MASKLAVEEVAIQKALAAMDNNSLLKGREAAKLFGANYDRLMCRRCGRPASSTRSGHNKKLEEPADNALKDYLVMLYHAGTPPNTAHVQHAASILIATLSRDHKAASRTKRWMVRQREYLKTLRTKPIAVQRMAAHVVEDIEEHFANFQKCRDKWGI